MLEREITISNRLGLHARASAKLVQALHGFEASASIACRGKEVNAKSIMGVMMLAAGPGTAVTLRTDGPEAEQAMQAMLDLFERKFDEGE
ncbi:MAG: HPr family phosphocarrier protein [Xanthomonadales bacterium]|nr:HPr family phosphocarrier protein [Xanthomonadales bacterium]